MTRNKHHRKKTNNNCTSSSSSHTNTSSMFHVLGTINEDGSKKEETHDVKKQKHSSKSKSSGSGPPVVEPQVDVEQQHSTRLGSNSVGSEVPVVEPQDDTEQQHSTRLGSNSVGSEVPVVEPQDDTEQQHSTRLGSNSSGSGTCFLEIQPDRHPVIIDRYVEFARRSRSSDGNEDDQELDGRWSLKVLLKYLFVMVAVILTTLCISSMNSLHVSPTDLIHGVNGSVTEGEGFGSMMLTRGYLNDREFDKGYKKRNQHELEDEEVGDLENVETAKNNEIEPVILVSEKMETLRVEDEIDVYVRLLGNLDSSGVNQESEILKPIVDENAGNEKRDQNDSSVSTKVLVAMQHEHQMDDEAGDLETVETDENISNERIEPVTLISEKMETFRVVDEIKGYIQLLGNLDSNGVNQESEILKPMVDDADGNKSMNENTNSVTKLAYFDPLFAAFSAIAVVIIASTSVLYCSMQTKISSPIDHINEVFDESSSVVSFDSKSSMRNQDACSSNQTNYFDFQQSTGDSPSHGSFTVEKKIVKKQIFNAHNPCKCDIRSDRSSTDDPFEFIDDDNDDDEASSVVSNEEHEEIDDDDDDDDSFEMFEVS
ncbi:hypothetical protein QVD17_29999 [Tagetes erecta]|uniref:Uncharacterized protein n=1 Tax=Tagetes erecta TaxID=13708 RepID=A0AAD8NMW3_TARER|nr:hypothetical protein QVD17_29999 [Tagetes erecta]